MRKYFERLKAAIAKLLGFIHSEFSPEQIEYALHWVKVAAKNHVDNAEKRAFVMGVLRRNLGLSESSARMLTEMAVRILKARLEREMPRG